MGEDNRCSVRRRISLTSPPEKFASEARFLSHIFLKGGGKKCQNINYE